MCKSMCHCARIRMYVSAQVLACVSIAYVSIACVSIACVSIACVSIHILACIHQYSMCQHVLDTNLGSSRFHVARFPSGLDSFKDMFIPGMMITVMTS